MDEPLEILGGFDTGYASSLTTWIVAMCQRSPDSVFIVLQTGQDIDGWGQYSAFHATAEGFLGPGQPITIAATEEFPDMAGMSYRAMQISGQRVAVLGLGTENLWVELFDTSTVRPESMGTLEVELLRPEFPALSDVEETTLTVIGDHVLFTCVRGDSNRNTRHHLLRIGIEDDLPAVIGEDDYLVVGSDSVDLIRGRGGSLKGLPGIRVEITTGLEYDEETPSYGRWGIDEGEFSFVDPDVGYLPFANEDVPEPREWTDPLYLALGGDEAVSLFQRKYATLFDNVVITLTPEDTEVGTDSRIVWYSTDSLDPTPLDYSDLVPWETNDLTVFGPATTEGPVLPTYGVMLGRERVLVIPLYKDDENIHLLFVRTPFTTSPVIVRYQSTGYYLTCEDDDWSEQVSIGTSVPGILALIDGHLSSVVH